MNKKIIYWAIKLSLGFLILYLLLSKIGIGKIISTLQEINLSYIPVILIVYYLSLALGILILKVIVSPLKKLSIGVCSRFFLLSTALAAFIPAKLGELSMVYFLKKEDIDLGPGLGLVLLDKIVSFFVVFMIALIGFIIFFEFEEYIYIILILILALIGFIFFIMSRFGRSITKRYILRRYSLFFKGFHKNLKTYLLEYKKVIFADFILTIVRFIMNFLVVYVVFLSLHIKISFFTVVLMQGIISLVSYIPITVNGIGIREFFAVVLYNEFSITPELILGSYIILILLAYSHYLLIISFLFKKRDLEIKKQIYGKNQNEDNN